MSTKNYWNFSLSNCLFCGSTFSDHNAHTKTCPKWQKEITMQIEEFEAWAKRPDITREQVQEVYLLQDNLAAIAKNNKLDAQYRYHKAIADTLRDVLQGKPL